MSSCITASCTDSDCPLWSRTPCGPPQLLSSSSFRFKLLLAPSVLVALHRSLLRARPRWSRLLLTGREQRGTGEDDDVRLIVDGVSESGVATAVEEEGLVVPVRREEEQQQAASLSGAARNELLEALMLSMDGFHVSPSLSHYLRLAAALSASSTQAELHVECLTPSLSLSLSPLPASSFRLQPSALLQSLLASAAACCQGYLTLSAEQELRLLHLPSDALSLPLLGVFTASSPRSLSAYLQCVHFLYCAALTRLTVAPLTFLLLSFQHSAFSLHEVTAHVPDIAIAHSAAELTIPLPPPVPASSSSLLSVELRPVPASLLPSLLSCSTAASADSAAGCGLYSEGELELTGDAVSPSSLRSPSPMAASPPRPHQTPLQPAVAAAWQQQGGNSKQRGRAEKGNERPVLPRREQTVQEEGVEEERASRVHAEEQRKRRLRAASVRMRTEKRRREQLAKKAAQQAAAKAAEEERQTRASSGRQRQRPALPVKQLGKRSGAATTQDSRHDRQSEQTTVTTAAARGGDEVEDRRIEVAAAVSSPPSPVQPTSLGRAAWTAAAASDSRPAVARLDDTRSECDAEERRVWVQRRIRAKMERKNRDSRRAAMRQQPQQPTVPATGISKPDSPSSLPALDPATLSLFAAALLQSLVASSLQQQQQRVASSQQTAEQLKGEELQPEEKEETPETTLPTSASSEPDAVSDCQALLVTQQAPGLAEQLQQEREMTAESESEEEQEMKYPPSPQPSSAVATEQEERQWPRPAAAASPPPSPRSASLSRCCSSSSSSATSSSSDSDGALGPLLLRLPASSPSAPPPHSSLPSRAPLDASIPRISMPAMAAGSSSDDEADSSSSEHERRLWEKYDKQQPRGNRRQGTRRSKVAAAAARGARAEQAMAAT